MVHLTGTDKIIGGVGDDVVHQHLRWQSFGLPRRNQAPDRFLVLEYLATAQIKLGIFGEGCHVTGGIQLVEGIGIRHEQVFNDALVHQALDGSLLGRHGSQWRQQYARHEHGECTDQAQQFHGHFLSCFW